MKLIILLSFIILIGIYIRYFIGVHIKHKRRMKKIQQFHNFNNQLIRWSQEIVDLSIRQKFIDESHTFMREKYGLEDLDICDLEKEKMRV